MNNRALARLRPFGGQALRFLVGTLVFALASLFATLPSHPSTPKNSSEELERIYAPFDSIRTDLSDYTWPSDPHLRITSAFADVRPFHLHAGLDVSTNHRKGYKVFASRSGYISHISMSPFGYGRFLFIRHADGYSTAYAHLQRFEDRIEAYVKDVQYRNGRYSLEVDIPPDVFPVSKGDLIAYTGDTGVGDAHFHFEIRDESLNPINPLLAPALARQFHDEIPPSFQSIAFIPLRSNSSVAGGERPLIKYASRTRKGDYSIPGIVHLSGSVGLAIKAFDRIGSSYYENRVNDYSLFLDDSLIMTCDVRRLPIKNFRQVALYYDWSLFKSGDGYFQNLFIERGNQLPFYDRLPEGSGIIHADILAEGPHEIRIVAKDFHSNESTLRVPVVFDHPFPIEVEATRHSVVVRTDDSSVTSISYVSSVQRAPLKTFAAARFASAQGSYELPRYTSRSVVGVVAENSHGSVSIPRFVVFHSPKMSNTSLGIEKEFTRDFLSVKVSSSLPLTMRPTVWFSSSTRRRLLDLTSIDASTYRASITLLPDDAGVISIQASADVNEAKHVEAFDESTIFPVTPENGGRIESANGDFSITFPPHGVYETLYCRIEKSEEGYSVSPDDALLDAGATVEYALPESLKSGRVGLFYANGDGWELLDWTVDGAKPTLRGSVGNLLGEFALLRDESPPALTTLHASYRRGRLHVSFNVLDDLAGTAADSLRIHLDDRLLIGEYDPYHHHVEFDDTVSVAAGHHVVAVESQDRFGNRSSTHRPLFIPSPAR
ncbi:MAG TPA: M23 family metallopeptidase [Bacteroidota bacterium]|nr:M23 family metallopeptidase [Bacteroidota bacterium]